MKKYFCVSDIHSFFDPFIKAIKDQGFDESNPDHILVVLGDLFDRGPDTIKVYDYVRSLPDDRFIFIRGNHEDLLSDCFMQIEDNEIISYHHVSNGTVKTIMAFSGVDEKYQPHFVYDPYYPLRGNALDKMPEILKYIRNKCVDYVEIGDCVLVHGWVPCDYGLMKEWRTLSKAYWEEARWLNGMEMWKYEYNRVPGKTVICGHWHCSWGWSHIRQKRQEFPQKNKPDWIKSFEPFVDDGIIAIDACTAYSGIVNCVVLEVED